MGCAASCVHNSTMFFRRNSSSEENSKAKLERKLYMAKESPDPEFDLSDCQLRQVPSGIYSICKVYRKEYLYLNNNNLESLDHGGQLSDLYLTKILNISSNRFSQLPIEVKYLVNLTELYLQNNNITHLPESINFLQRLLILDVSQNKLKKLTPSLGKLINLKTLRIIGNPNLTALCPEICFAQNIIQLDMDSQQFIFPPQEVVAQGTVEIMKYLCDKMNVEYSPPSCDFTDNSPKLLSSNPILSPFERKHSVLWEEQEAAMIQKEEQLHKAAKLLREKNLSQILRDQNELDAELAKVHDAKYIERQRLYKTIQDDEKEIAFLVKSFIQSVNLKPEEVQQQLQHEQAEHERLLEVIRQNYDNVRKADVLKAMETVINEYGSFQSTKKSFQDNFNNVKESMLLQELECTEKLNEFFKAKDQSHTIFVDQLLEDQDIQKAVVASLIEKVDARTWSLNQEISLISSKLAKLSIIEQEKKRKHVSYNYNEMLQQRVQMVNLLEDLFNQQKKRRNQLKDTLKEMASDANLTTDFWLKNYQKLVESAPKLLLDTGKALDPLLANYLLQEGVIHCLPFLVKFLFSNKPLEEITPTQLRENGVSLLSDRDGILRAVSYYINAKSENHNHVKPKEDSLANNSSGCTGVVDPNAESASLESECVICMDAKCEVIFVPCGHLCCCLVCSNNDLNECPMCRSSIEKKIKVIVV